VQKYIAKYKETFDQFPVSAIAFPRGVSGMKQYAGSPIYAPKTPMAVRAALLYNHYIKRHGLEQRYPLIREGDKIKFVYLKMPNPIRENVMAFSTEIPPEFGLNNFIDYDTQFEKVFVEPLKTIMEPLNWSAVEVSSLEDFFG
jgi:hypothetical protein